MSEHRLKTWPIYFDAVARGDKTFEVRRNDRSFQKGDTLMLRRYHPDGYYSAGVDPITATVKYVLTGGQFGIKPEFVVMAIEVVSE